MTTLETKKKQTRVRHWFQAAWFALTNGYLRGYTSGKIFTGNTKAVCVPGLNCYSCPGAIGACPIGSLQAVLDSKNYKISLYVFGFLTAFGVLFGRLVCGWMCPFGFFQDLLYKIKTKFKKKNLPGHKYLRYLRYVVLIVLVIILPSFLTNAAGAGQPTFCEFVCPSGTLLGGIPLTIVNEGFRAAIGVRFWWKIFILVACTLAAIFYYRPFCKYLCPLGAIYGLFNPVSTYRLEVDQSKCIKCAACQRACGMDIRTFEKPNSPDCIRCGSCIKACPEGAISSTWGKFGAKAANRCFVDDNAAFEARDTSRTPATRPVYSVFFGVVLILFALVNGLLAYLGTSSIFEYNLVHLISVPYTGLGYQFCNFISSFVILFTGVFLIVYRNDAARMATVREKLGYAFRIALFGVILLIIAACFDPTAVSPMTTALLFSPALVLTYFLMLATASSFGKYVEGRTKGKAASVILLILMVLPCVIEFTFLYIATH